MGLSRRGGEAPKPGDWMEEIHLPKRRLLVHAVHHRPGHPPHVEFLVEGRPSDRLSLALEVVQDGDRFRRVASSRDAA